MKHKGHATLHIATSNFNMYEGNTHNQKHTRCTHSATGKCQLQKIWWAWTTHLTEGKIIQAKVLSPW